MNPDDLDGDEVIVDPWESRCRRLAEARRDRDVSKVAAEKAEKTYREVEAALIADLEASAKRGSLEYDFGDELGLIKFTRKKTIYGTIVDKAAALESFEAEARIDEMTGPSIEKRRLNDYVKERLENHQELPPGVGYHERKYIQIQVKERDA